MKNVLFLSLLSSVLLLGSCGSSDNDPKPANPNDSIPIIPIGPTMDTVNISITAEKNSYSIGEVIFATISAPDTISSYCVSYDGFQTESFCRSSGVNPNIYEGELTNSFDRLGTHTIWVKGSKEGFADGVDTLQVEITRSNAVKINQVKVNSFYRMDSIWDSEFSETDIERLADVQLSIFKNLLIDNEYRQIHWYRPEVRSNQSSLVWNLESLEMYSSKNNVWILTLSDADENGLSEDLMNGWNALRGYSINLSQFAESKPDTIKISEPSINLDVHIAVEWID